MDDVLEGRPTFIPPGHHAVQVYLLVPRVALELLHALLELLQPDLLISWELPLGVPQLEQLDLEGGGVRELQPDVLRVDLHTCE